MYVIILQDRATLLKAAVFADLIRVGRFPEMGLFAVDTEICARLFTPRVVTTTVCPVCNDGSHVASFFAISMATNANYQTQLSDYLGVGRMNICGSVMTTEISVQSPYIVLDFVGREVDLSAMPMQITVRDKSYRLLSCSLIRPGHYYSYVRWAGVFLTYDDLHASLTNVPASFTGKRRVSLCIYDEQS